MGKKDFNKALNYSFLLLKYRARSRNEINQRLIKKKYPPSIVKKVVQYLEENKYIDDEDFASIFIATALQKGWGPRKVDYALKQLGIPEELRKQALESKCAYRDKLRQIILQRIKYYHKQSPALPTNKMWQKLVRHLGARGFDYQDIQKILEEMGINRYKDRHQFLRD